MHFYHSVNRVKDVCIINNIVYVFEVYTHSSLAFSPLMLLVSVVVVLAVMVMVCGWWC